MYAKEPSTNQPEDPKNFNPFKQKEKQYKFYQGKQTDYSGLSTFSADEELPEGASRIEVIHPRTNKPVKGVKLSNGLVVLKAYTEPERQLAFCYKALNTYHRKPHRTNLYIYEAGYQEKPQPLEKGEEPKTRQYDKHWYLVND